MAIERNAKIVEYTGLALLIIAGITLILLEIIPNSKQEYTLITSIKSIMIFVGINMYTLIPNIILKKKGPRYYLCIIYDIAIIILLILLQILQ